MLQRRHFLPATASAALAAVSLRGASAAERPRALMKLGCQSGPTNERRLNFFKRHGVEHICGYPRDPGERGYWLVEDLLAVRELTEKHGVSLDMVALPFLTSSHVDREKRAAIVLGQSPERDRDIEHVQKMIEACAKAGVPAIKYNLSLLGVLRTARTPGRGGSSYSTWRLKEARPDPPLTRAGRVTADIFWERITYFLERVIPVATEFKVRLACHPHDPGVPPGYQGVDRVLGTVEGLKRFISIRESAYHGLNFCQGTVMEMLKDPGREIFDIIRHFGQRKKIFNVHFRNIRGGLDDFQEVYPDEGDADFLKCMLVYKEVGYPYMMMPDHVPSHPDDPGGLQAYAFAYGHIRGLIQAADAMG